MKSHNFFTELKRRNVIRMAGLYLVGAWLAVQVAGTGTANVWGARLAAPHHRRFARDRFRPGGDL
jgi:putative heme degradation protein